MLHYNSVLVLQTAPGSSPPPSPTAAPPVVERTATGKKTADQYSARNIIA